MKGSRILKIVTNDKDDEIERLRRMFANVHEQCKESSEAKAVSFPASQAQEWGQRKLTRETREKTQCRVGVNLRL